LLLALLSPDGGEYRGRCCCVQATRYDIPVVSLLVAVAAGQVQCLQRITSGGLVEVFFGTQVLDRVPGFAILLSEQLVGFGVVHELLFVAVPAQLAAEFEGDVGHVRRAGRAVRGLEVGIWLLT
jgi:hypothetical protein